MRHMRNFLLFAIGRADTFEGYISPMCLPLYPCAAGHGSHMIAAPVVMLATGLLTIWAYPPAHREMIQVLVFLVAGLALMGGVLIWPFGMAWLNWRNFKRQHPERVTKGIRGPEMIIGA
jgi:hypothetical protein